jgi:hypothetical protein
MYALSVYTSLYRLTSSEELATMALRLVTTPSARRDSTRHAPNGPFFSPSVSQTPVTPATVPFVAPQSSSQTRVLGGLFALSKQSGKGARPEEDISRLEPDELFTRYTVAEVKMIAARLQ